MPKRIQDSTAIPVRIPNEDAAALKLWAKRFGRTVQDELRLSVRLHLRQHMLASLATDEGREEARAGGFDPDADLPMIEESLAYWQEKAYTRASPDPITRTNGAPVH